MLNFISERVVYYACYSVETNIVKTEIAEPSLNPIWNTTLEMPNVRSETLVEKQMEVILYDYRPDKEDVILGINNNARIY